MDIRFRAGDGGEYPIPDLATLYELVAKGVVTPATPLYDEVSGGWVAAKDHPRARDRFEPPAPEPAPAQPRAYIPESVLRTAPERPGSPLWRAAGVLCCAAALAALYVVFVRASAPQGAAGWAAVAGVSLGTCALFALVAWGLERTYLDGTPGAYARAFSVLVALAVGGLVIASLRATTAGVEPGGLPKPRLLATQIEERRRGPAGIEAPRDAEGLTPEDREVLDEAGRAFFSDLKTEETRAVERLRALDLPGILKAENMGTSWGLTEARRRLQEAQQAVADFESGIRSAMDLAETRISTSTLPVPARDGFLRGFREGRDAVMPQLSAYLALIRDYLAEGEGTVTFLQVRGGYEVKDGAILFRYPEDLQTFQAHLQALQSLHQRGLEETARLEQRLTRGPR